MFRSFIDGVGLLLFPFRPDYYRELDLKLRYTVAFLLNVAFAGLLVLALYHVPVSWRNGALSILTALALFALGSVVGFILALPRFGSDGSTQLITPANGAQTSQTQNVSATTGGSLIGFNNNLVDISDWITKSVVALSIANYKDLVPALQGAASYLAVENTGPARSEAMAIILGYSSLGLLYAYITTRTLVTSLLRDSAAPPLGNDVTKAVENAGRIAVKALDPAQTGDEPKRSAEGITAEEKDAASSIANQASGVPLAAIKIQIDQLATQYAEVRANQKPSAGRTAAMEEIAGKMRALSLAANPMLQELKTADKAGLRLAAISILEMKPDPAEADWLTQRLSTESPFLGYHAAIALREAAATVACDVKQPFLSALDSGETFVPPASDRARVLSEARRKVEERCGA